MVECDKQIQIKSDLSKIMCFYYPALLCYKNGFYQGWQFSLFSFDSGMQYKKSNEFVNQIFRKFLLFMIKIRLIYLN